MLTPLILAGKRLEQLLNPGWPGDTALEVGVVSRRRLRGSSGQVYYLYVPRSAGKKPPLMVSVHGGARNARQHALLLSTMAERYGVVLLAPLFSNKQFPDYQRLGRSGCAQRSDLALDRVIAEVGDLTGADVGRFFLFGYAEGGQFAHRYAMVHPERVAGAVIGAAGWQSAQQEGASHVDKAGVCRDLPGMRFDTGKFLQIPMTVVVGDQETDPAPRANELALIDVRQGDDHLEHAQRWARTMNLVARSHGLPAHFRVEMIPGLDYSFEHGIARGAMHRKIFAHLFDNPHCCTSELSAQA